MKKEYKVDFPFLGEVEMNLSDKTYKITLSALGRTMSLRPHSPKTVVAYLATSISALLLGILGSSGLAYQILISVSVALGIVIILSLIQHIGYKEKSRYSKIMGPYIATAIPAILLSELGVSNLIYEMLVPVYAVVSILMTISLVRHTIHKRRTNESTF
jgi:tellurite resistance protein TehA-like permease